MDEGNKGEINCGSAREKNRGIQNLSILKGSKEVIPPTKQDGLVLRRSCLLYSSLELRRELASN